MVKNIKERGGNKKQVRGNPPDSWTEGQKDRNQLEIRERRLVTSVPLCGTEKSSKLESAINKQFKLRTCQLKMFKWRRVPLRETGLSIILNKINKIVGSV